MDEETILNTLFAKNIIPNINFFLTFIEKNMYIINTIFSDEFFLNDTNFNIILSISDNITIIDTKGKCVCLKKQESIIINSTSNTQQSDIHLWIPLKYFDNNSYDILESVILVSNKFYPIKYNKIYDNPEIFFNLANDLTIFNYSNDIFNNILSIKYIGVSKFAKLNCVFTYKSLNNINKIMS